MRDGLLTFAAVKGEPIQDMAEIARDAEQDDAARGYERCIVTFIDILGYRELLRTRQSWEIRDALDALRRFTRGDGDDEKRLRPSDEFRLYSQAFSESVSDAVVRVRTIETQSLDGPFLYELLDLVHAQVECVNRGMLIRGGLAIGPVHVGIDGKGPIFGEAMVRAYEIEQSEAVYPRIMIDDAAMAEFLQDPTLWQHGQFDENDAEMAGRYIAVSEDGSYFLDYLNAADAGEFDEGEIGRFAFLRRHRDVVESALASATGKARRKLMWLAHYHNRFIAALRELYDETDPGGTFEAEVGVGPRVLFDNLIVRGSGPDLNSALSALIGPGNIPPDELGH